MLLKVPGRGPAPAKIMIVGEFPSSTDEEKGSPFSESSSTGSELSKMLHEAGILRTECYITNVCKSRPFASRVENLFDNKKDLVGPTADLQEGIRELAAEIRAVRPNVIIALGNLALYALLNRPSGKAAITSWRGSELPIATNLAGMDEPLGHECVVIPTYSPSLITARWDWRQIAVHDLRTRVRKYIDNPRVTVPNYEFTIRPTYAQVETFLSDFLRRLDAALIEGRVIKAAVDIETRAGHISCVGFATSPLRAICIPYMCVERPEGYWSIEEEVALNMLMQRVLTHPAIHVTGQNFAYDAQYFAKHLGFIPRVRDDTLLKQHTAWPGVQKALDFISSMYCEFHQYWKDEGKEWDFKKHPEEQHWAYNCKDCVITYEANEVLDQVIHDLGLEPQYDLIMQVWWRCVELMLRGVRIDLQHRAKLAGEILQELATREETRTYICGHPLLPTSPKQMKEFFYEDLRMPKQYSRKKNANGMRPLTCDDDALHALARKEPLLLPLLRNIAETRSLGVFLSTFVQAKLGEDRRLRSYYNAGGTETFRLSSSKDAFGSGANLQNTPKGLEDEEIEKNELVQYKLPNIRKLFLPDPDHEVADVDLAGADAQVVAWDANDPVLKEIFRKGLKLHVENGKLMYGEAMMGPTGKREPYYTRVKMGCHMTNYGAVSKTVSTKLNIPLFEAEKFQRKWFEVHPWINDWHKRTEHDLMMTRSVRNQFGFRRYYFDRVEGLLPEALAWKPQSTIALVANIAWCNISREYVQGKFSDHWKRFTHPNSKEIRDELLALGLQPLMQVHDSLVVQYPIRNREAVLPLLRLALAVTIPYDDPLVIPWGLKTSTVSWGDAEDQKWPALTEKVAA